MAMSMNISGKYPTEVWWEAVVSCVVVKTRIKSGVGMREVGVRLDYDDLLAKHDEIKDGTEPWHLTIPVKHGAGMREIVVDVPIAALTEIATALRGYHDDDDAHHRLWHLCWPGEPVPCSSCREMILAAETEHRAARRAFVLDWIRSCGGGEPVAAVEIERLEQFLDDVRRAGF